MAFEGTVLQTHASGINGILQVENAQYVLADGRALNKTTYAALYAVLGSRYGEGGDNFIIPDMRGYYMRGDSLDSNRDADYTTRVLYGPNATASGVGSYQPAAFYSHTHFVDGQSPGSRRPFSTQTNYKAYPADAPNSVATSGVNQDSLKVELERQRTNSVSGISISPGIMNPPTWSWYTYIKAT